MSDSLSHRELAAAVGLVVALAGVPRAEAASTGYGAAGWVEFAGACWGASFTLDNINTSDDAWATCAGGTNNGRVSNFDFSIPASATITGIEVEVEGNDGTGGSVDYAVQLSWDNSTTWTALKAGTFTGAADTTTVLGGPADDWGHAWTPAEFAVFQLRIRRTAGGDLRVDRIRVNVHYTLASATIGLYRSVGTNAANLNTSLRTVQIAGTTATFSGPMPANVGVGDVLQYQVAAVYYLAFISGRTSDTVYTVQSSTGGTPQAALVGTAVNVYRAYTSLSGWSTQSENASINVGVRNFDTSTDLVTPNVVMNVACYGDGPDTTAVTVSGWTTAATNYIRIYTPVSPAEVGTSQRHPGRWDTSKYRLEAANDVLWIEAYYARVEGLQVRLTADVADVGGIFFTRGSGSGVSGYEVSSNIVRGNGAGSSNIRIGINVYAAGSGVLKVWNNVVYDWRGGSNWVAGIVPDDPDYTSYIYNNTIVDCEYGIDVLEGTVIAKNNLVYGSAIDNYYGAYAASSTHNLSGPTQTDAPGSNPLNATTVTFLNAPGDDFHLGATDTGARGQGADLSADAELPFAVDVDGGPRRAPWDIGADEAEALVQGHYHWRNDDGSETTATWPVAEDTPLTTIPRMAVRRVRFEVSNEGAVASGAVEYRLQGAQSGSCATATYTDVPVDFMGTWDWQVTDSTNFTDGDVTTNVGGGVTDEATTFVPGQLKDAGNYTLGGITLNVDQFTEIEFAVRATVTAVAGANYCFRLYDMTNNRPLDGYSAYAQGTTYDPTLTLANHPSGQVPDQLTNVTPATITAFRFRLSRLLTVTVDTLRIGFTTGGGIANGDVSAGELWEDTNGNGAFDGAGPDTLLQGSVTPVGGILTFTTDFTPAPSGTNYFLRATIANLVQNDTTTFSLDAAGIDEVEAGVVEAGAIANATHTQDPPPPTEVFYSIGTSIADLKSGTPNVSIVGGVATFDVAQTANVGVGDLITYGTVRQVYIRSVLSQTRFVVHDPTGAVPSDSSGVVNSITRAFNSIAAAESGSVDANHLTTGDLVGTGRKLTWVCYSDGPFNVAATTAISGYTTDAFRYITLTVAGSSQVASTVSQRHSGRAGSGTRIEVGGTIPGSGVVLEVDEAYTRVEWLEIDGNDYEGNTGIDVLDPGGTGSVLQYLLIHDLENTPPAGQGDGFGLSLGADNVTVRNSIVYEYGEDGIYASGTGIRVENSTFYRSTNTPNVGEAIQVTAGGSLTAENVIATDSAFYHDAGGTFVCNNSVSSDGSANDAAFGCSGTGNLINRSAASLFASITAPIDLHLRYGAAAVDAGKDLSASFADDVDGQARPLGAAWDVGADEAGAQMLVKSGTYLGNGSTQSIADVGFRPDLVIISSDSTNANVGTGFPSGHTDVLRTSTMSGNVSKAAYVYAYHPLVDRITSLDANGFTVGHPPNHNAPNDNPGDPYHCVNHNNVRYYWVALKAAPGEMAVGTYTGNGAATQDVTTVGFQPDYTLVLPDSGTDPIHRFALQPADYSLDFDGGSQCPAGCSRSPESGIRTELANGFRVGEYVNNSGDTYHYVAWKNTPGRIAIGTYTGDSGDNRSISGLGFRPELVTVANAVTPIPNNSTVYKTASTGSSHDYSLVYIAYSSGWQGADDIQALEADGFQVGTSDAVNAWNEPIHYAAFGPGSPAGAATNYRSIGTAANYATGQVSVVNGSATVTGIGTQWLTANRGRGDHITITGQGTYTILGVWSETALALTRAFSGASGTYGYTIGRKFTTIDAWRACIDTCGACGVDPNVPSDSLVADNRLEVGVLYKDSPFTGVGAEGGSITQIGAASGDTSCPTRYIATDAGHYVEMTADGANRHHGVPGAGVVIDGQNLSSKAGMIRVWAPYTHIEWVEIKNVCGSPTCSSTAAIKPEGASANGLLINDVILHDSSEGVRSSSSATSSWTIRNSIIYNNAGPGIDPQNATDNVTVESCTIFRNGGRGVERSGNPVTVRNTLALHNVGGDFDTGITQSYNVSSDATASGTGSLTGQIATDLPGATPNRVVFRNCPSGIAGCNTLPAAPGVGVEGGNYNLLLQAATVNTAVNAGLDLSATFRTDIEGEFRPTGAGTWDIGADELNGFTAVKLAWFTARGFESAVVVEWETASELDNLGFHLYRAPSPDGPWARLNASLIPGLGSSPEGKSYRYVDSGLANGTTYFYRLEDVDRRGRLTSHGPVSATAVAGLPEPGEGEGPTEPSPSPRETPKPVPERKAHGDPTQQSLRVLERTASGVTLELVTGGFYSEEQEDGTSKLLVPGFFDHAEPGFPTVPTRRSWTDAVVGRGVVIVSVEPSDPVTFSGLSVSLAGKPVAVAASDGTYRASSIPVRPGTRSSRDAAITRSGPPAATAAADSPGLFPARQAVVHQTAFQGERKKAYVELAPLQVDEASGDVNLARRLVVRLAFSARVEGETGRGNVGRSNPLAADAPGTQVLARLATRSRGLHAVAFEEIPGLSSPVAPSALRLSRLGAPVAFHLEPHRRPFGPGSVLSFLAEGSDAAYANEAVYELAIAPGGIQMGGALPSRRAAPTTPLTLLRHERSFETDAIYLPALLEARDLWVWDLGIPGGGNASYAFTLDSLALVPETARIAVDLQGGSDTETDPDHHVLAFVNGSFVGETRFDGMVPHTLTLEFPSSLLLEGENTLRLENAGDTGSAASHLYLDRFSVEVPREISPLAGLLEGRADRPGRATLAASPGALLLDVTGTVPRFLARVADDGRLAWNAEKDHRYLAVGPEAFLEPEVRPAPPVALRSPANQADWIVIAPQALLPAAEALRAHRESQGLAAVAVSLEAVVDEFGYGEAGIHALQGFLAFAFHSWQAPSPRYVLLLGEASYDPKGHLAGTSRPDLVPSPLTKSTFLWTSADPLYAAVNGLDSLPDIALGRINAATLAEAQAAVQKILGFETSGQSLAGEAVLVADNPDAAGDFEANQDEIATLLPSRTVERLFLARLGATATKSGVRSGFDSGLSLMSYVGHGSSGLWASEGILRSPDVASFAPQVAQPLVLAMTCSNGYFLSPFSNSLAERLVLAEQKGAIAAFAPSGLSLNEAAHVYHRAVVTELELGGHPRLGDLLLAAQASYAASGAFPELLDFYNLLGDPGMTIR